MNGEAKGRSQPVNDHEPVPESNPDAVRLWCVRQIAETDEDTLKIVKAVLTRALPASHGRAKRRTRGEIATNKGGGE